LGSNLEEDCMDPTNDTPNLPRLMTIAEVADHLGVEVRHVRRLVHERRIPFIKWGHLLRFDPADIQKWIDDFKQDPRRPRLGA
jgi:excisionase family DNA binding protein